MRQVRKIIVNVDNGDLNIYIKKKTYIMMLSRSMTWEMYYTWKNFICCQHMTTRLNTNVQSRLDLTFSIWTTH